MKPKCEKCGKPATVFLTDITDGKKLEKHLCEDCAGAEGVTVKSNVPIAQLLEDFILQSSSGAAEPEAACDVCGMTFSQFRRGGLLGCPNDYEAFGAHMAELLERSQEGASQHVGKVPLRAGGDQKKQNAILRLRAELKAAVSAEQYERAAELRDRIQRMEAL